MPIYLYDGVLFIKKKEMNSCYTHHGWLKNVILSKTAQSIWFHSYETWKRKISFIMTENRPLDCQTTEGHWPRRKQGTLWGGRVMEIFYILTRVVFIYVHMHMCLSLTFSKCNICRVLKKQNSVIHSILCLSFQKVCASSLSVWTMWTGHSQSKAFRQMFPSGADSVGGNLSDSFLSCFLLLLLYIFLFLSLFFTAYGKWRFSSHSLMQTI